MRKRGIQNKVRYTQIMGVNFSNVCGKTDIPKCRSPRESQTILLIFLSVDIPWLEGEEKLSDDA